jgi:methyltransferase (TIGR00027 family)
MAVSVLRAAHQLVDGEPKILDDPVSVRILPPEVVSGIRANPFRLSAPAAVALRSHVLVRSRYAEDRARDAAARGVRQMVALGAGMDTFAYRQPAWAREMRLFEVDHPASQATKRETLEQAGIEIPDNLTFVAADLEAGPPGEALRAAGFDEGQPAVLSMLGVTMYLGREALDATFRWAAGLRPGSELVFTFSPPRPPDQPDGGLAMRAAAAGEPWRTRIGAEDLHPLLESFGFSKIEFVSPELLERLYYLDRTDGLEPPRASRICVATV